MVKYSEGPETSVATQISAPISVVWPLVCDINLPGRFSKEFVRAEGLEDGPALGATFRPPSSKHSRPTSRSRTIRRYS